MKMSAVFNILLFVYVAILAIDILLTLFGPGEKHFGRLSTHIVLLTTLFVVRNARLKKQAGMHA